MAGYRPRLRGWHRGESGFGLRLEARAGFHHAPALGQRGLGFQAVSLGAVIAGRSLQSLLYGIVAVDPVVLGGATAIMIAVALCATLLPARAAARCDPNALLQVE